MVVYTNGCSHSQDLFMCEESKSRKFTWPRIFMDKLVKEYAYLRYDYENLINRYGPQNFVEKDVHNILVNDAADGAGNDYIFHTTLKNVTKLIEIGKKPDYIIIQFSSPNRRYTFDGDGNKFVNPHDYSNLHELLLHEPVASEHTFNYIFSLQEILKKWEINYRFFLYFRLETSLSTNVLMKSIETDKIVNINDTKAIDGLLDYFKTKSYNRDEQGHPNDFGVKTIVEKVYNSFFYQ